MRALPIAVGLVVLSFGAAASAQSRLPGSLEAAVHAKVLSFDKSLAGSSAPLVIGVAFNPSSSVSTVSATNIAEGFQHLVRKRVTVHSRTLSIVRIPIAGNVDAALRKQRLHAVYAADDLDALIPRIAQSASNLRIRTLSGNRSYVAAGLAVAVVVKNRRPSIVLKIANASSVGMSLDPRLVRLAELVK